MTKRFGFTLAEVLITLGIIGVVAAMTMPTLINQTNGAQYKAAYKKALSAISQGVTLNVALDDYDLKDLSGDDDTGNGTLLSLFKKRMNVVKDATENAIGDGYSPKDDKGAAWATWGSSADNTAVFFNDGSMFSYPTATAGCSKKKDGTVVGGDGTEAENDLCKGFIDVNGIKGPNKMVQCDDKDSGNAEDCTVTSPTDIYPVIFYDQAILPNSDAARATLFGKS